MEYRPAVREDLPQLRTIYTEIYRSMEASGVFLWNEHYPYDAFAVDIEKGRLWLLCDGDNIAAAFVLDKYEETGGIAWEDDSAGAAVLMRLGVNPAYQKRSLGRECMRYAAELARARGCDYLRLYVVDSNTPAEQFYIRCGFRRAGGEHREHVDGIPGELTEYGYEIRT